MPRTKPLTPLAARKRLLIAESEINRAQLVRDGQIILDGVHAVTEKARSISWLASMAGLLAAGFAAFRGKSSNPLKAKPSWIRTAANGVKTILPLWLALRRRTRNRTSKQRSESSSPER